MPGSILDAIGNTPLVDLTDLVPSGGGRLVAKFEPANPTGSMKDRMALAMVDVGLREGALEPGQPVVEYTGGSTGTSLAMVCAVRGHGLTIVTNDAVAEEKIASMRALGAEVLVLETPEGKVYPGLVERMRAEVDRLVEESGAYWTAQMENPHQLEGYVPMAREVLAQVPGVTDLVQAVGTGGSSMGLARVLRPKAGIKVHLVEVAESPWLSKGEGGPHNIEGTAGLKRPPLLDDALFDDVLVVPEDEAFAMTRRLARERGVFVGPSSGMNVAAGARVAAASEDAVVVTVLVDTGFKYLGGPLFR